MRRLFGTQGFRGLANTTLTSPVAHGIGLALASFLKGEGTIAVGWDARTSSEMLSHAASAGIMAGGCNVHLIGLVPTPVLSYAIPFLNCAAGMMITASHNPPEFNGIKLWGSDGASFTTEMERQIETFYFQEKASFVSWDQCGHIKAIDDIRPHYIQQVLAEIKHKQIARSNFRVIADCGGGAASAIIPELFTGMGVEVHPIHCTPDGFFSNRLPEPKEENLTKLIQCVKEQKADLGMAWDGDADRIVFVTEKGRYLMGDRTFALAAFQRLRNLKKKPRRIVTQVATSDVIKDVATTVEAEIVLTKVGEPNIVTKMKETKAQIGGEENGGVIYQGWSWTREGILTALIILEILADQHVTLEQLDQQFPTYAQVKESIQCPNEDKAALLARVIEQAPSDAEWDALDGMKIRYSDGWLLLRPSGTEPIFRIFAEARTKQRARQLVEMGLKLTQDAYNEIQSKDR